MITCDLSIIVHVILLESHPQDSKNSKWPVAHFIHVLTNKPREWKGEKKGCESEIIKNNSSEEFLTHTRTCSFHDCTADKRHFWAHRSYHLHKKFLIICVRGKGNFRNNMDLSTYILVWENCKIELKWTCI